jgi:hypothetical protein
MLYHFISTKWHEGSYNHLVCTVNVRAFTQCKKEQDRVTHDLFLHKKLLERLRKITRKWQSVYIPHLIHVAHQYLTWWATPMEKNRNKNGCRIKVLMQILHTESEFTSWAWRIASCTYERAIWDIYNLHAFLLYYALAENGSECWQILLSLTFRISILPNSVLLNFSMHTILSLDSIVSFLCISTNVKTLKVWLNPGHHFHIPALHTSILTFHNFLLHLYLVFQPS